MQDKIKPIVNSTYPALMAGLCLTFLAISQTQSKLLIGLISIASFLFILSSFFLFVYSVYIVSGGETDDNKSEEGAKSISWKIVKHSFFLGIFLLLISTFIVVCDLWLFGSIQSLLSNLSGLLPISETNSTNITLNQSLQSNLSGLLPISETKLTNITLNQSLQSNLSGLLPISETNSINITLNTTLTNQT